MANNGEDSALQLTLALAIIVGAVVVGLVLYKDRIIFTCMTFAFYELQPWDFFAKVETVRRNLCTVSPAELSYLDALSVLNFGGRIYGLIIIPAVLLIVVKDWRSSVSDIYVRKLSRTTLLDNNVVTSCCIAPILKWPGSILDESNDSGPWKTARQPIQFVAEHGLLVDPDGNVIPPEMLLNDDNLADPRSPVLSGKPKVHLDREKAYDVFCQQFGPLHQGFYKMPKHLQKLSLAFLLFGVDRKDEAQKILDEMNTTLMWPGTITKWKIQLGWPLFKKVKVGGYAMDLSLPLKISKIDELLRVKEVSRATAAHDKYTYLYILALYRFAREKGVLPTSEFIWLRPLNRTLYYLLNNLGRRTVWSECAGPWAHFSAEDQMQNADNNFHGASLDTDAKQVSEAINALEVDMYEEGWIISLADVSQKAQSGRLGLADEDGIESSKGGR